MNKPLHSTTAFRSSQPLVPLILFFILGIVAGSYQRLTDKLAFPFLIVFMLVLAVGIMRKWRYNFPLICIIFFLLGDMLSSQQINPRLPQNHIKIIVEHYNNGKRDEPGIRIEGVLYNSPERFSDKTRLYIDAERVFTQKEIVPVIGKILITVGSPSVRVNYGDRIRFIAKLRIPRNFGNPGEFDYAGSLAREGIYVTGHVENERWIAALAEAPEGRVRPAIEQTRNRIRDFINSSDVENSAIIKALIIGEQGEIPKEIRNDFNNTSTTHILSISGLHVGIVALAAYLATFQLLRQSERLALAVNIKILAAVSSIIPVLLYGAIAGFSVPTERSVIMVIVFILAVIADRERSLYNTVAAAALVILIISPLAIYDISFQLSFMSVLAILYLAPKIQGLWINKNKEYQASAKLLQPNLAWKGVEKYLLNPLAVSIATFGTAPFVAWHFHRVSFIGVFANLIAVPLMGFAAVIFGLVSCAVSFFSQSLAWPLLKLADIVISLSLRIIDLFARLPYASVYTTTPTIFEAVLFYSLMICIVEFKRGKFFKYGLVTAALVLMVNYLYWHYHLNYNPNLKVTFISVGQGDSALVEFPYGKRMLIDGGGFYSEDFDVGERIVAPFLWKNKIKNIDYIILSHPQSDHMKGLKFIAKRFGAKEFIWNGEMSNERAFADLMSALDKNNVKKLIADASTAPLDINGVKVQFLNPPADSNLDTNNKSLMARLSYKDVSFLFTGDIEAVGETALLKRNENIGAAILKVPHHGSITSSTVDFLKAVNPKLAVISAGYSNPFGFPRPEILKRYEDFKIPVLRTDINGAATVETDGIGIKTIAYR